MSKKILMDAFFNQFGDFLAELIRVFPNDTDFPAYKTGLTLLHKTNPMIVIQTVHEHVTPYEDQIKTKNEDFILKHSFSDHTGNDDALEQVIRKLRDQWLLLTPNNKACIWSYVTILLELAKKCTSL
jgi:hypothetical protein